MNVSDHGLIYVIRKKEKVIKTKMTFSGRSYRNYERELFQENVTNADWDIFYATDRVDQAWSYFLGIIQDEINIMCPLKNIKIKKKKDPWITNDILEFKNDKNDLLNVAKNTQLVDDWQAARNARNLVASIVKDAKKKLPDKWNW